MILGTSLIKNNIVEVKKNEQKNWIFNRFNNVSSDNIV
jgi:hypothetical protein